MNYSWSWYDALAGATTAAEVEAVLRRLQKEAKRGSDLVGDFRRILEQQMAAGTPEAEAVQMAVRGFGRPVIPEGHHR